MKLQLINRQTQQKIDAKAIRNFLQKLATKLQEETPHMKWSEIACILLDDDQTRVANQHVFGRNESTDVITQHYEPLPPHAEGYTAEILINIHRAREEGQRRGDPDRELALYIAHGCLHLTGADDLTPADQAAMSRTQEAWLDELLPGTPAFFMHHQPPQSPA